MLTFLENLCLNSGNLYLKRKKSKGGVIKKDKKSSDKEKKIVVIIKPTLILKSLELSKSCCIFFVIAFKNFECLIYKIEKSF